MAETLLSRVAAGDSSAVAEVVSGFGALVWALARRLSPTPADAEDAVQEIFLDVWKSAGRFDPAQGSETMFVAMIARRRLIDRIRRHRQQPQGVGIEAIDESGAAVPGTRGEIAVEAERAARAVGRLAADQQRVIALAVMDGLTHSEIAAATGMPLGTVKTQMRRGLMQLRTLLGTNGVDAQGRSAAPAPDATRPAEGVDEAVPRRMP
jgi:RNA polymerase sigma-70 factor (ECF subfamily)